MATPAYNVLIADDSEDDRFFLRRLLERFPRFRVIREVCDGLEAIEFLSNAKSNPKSEMLPDLLFLDLKMPHKGGFEVLEWMRTQNCRPLTVAVLSSSALVEDQRQSLRLGADGFWVKTADSAVQNSMVAALEAMLDERANALKNEG